MSWSVLLLLFFCWSVDANPTREWSYGKASCCAQEDNWQEAQQRMSTLMVDDPDDVSLLYDSGVVAYRMKEFEKADAYFGQVAKQDSVSQVLKKQASFNLGNTKVALNQLQQAVSQYEDVLLIDPQNERAKHNIEKVKEMLQQQQQQQQKQQSKQNQDKQQNNSGDSDQQNQKSQHDQKQDQSQQSSDQSNAAKRNNESGDQGQESPGSKQEEQERANQQQKGQKEDQVNDESNNEHSDKEQREFRDEHASSSQDNAEQDQRGNQSKLNEFHHTKEQQKEQDAPLDITEDVGQDFCKEQHKELEEQLAPGDRWMARVLQQRDKAEQKMHKQFIKATVDKKLTGQDGQNCW